MGKIRKIQHGCRKGKGVPILGPAVVEYRENCLWITARRKDLDDRLMSTTSFCENNTQSVNCRSPSEELIKKEEAMKKKISKKLEVDKKAEPHSKSLTRKFPDSKKPEVKKHEKRRKSETRRKTDPPKSDQENPQRNPDLEISIDKKLLTQTDDILHEINVEKSSKRKSEGKLLSEIAQNAQTGPKKNQEPINPKNQKQNKILPVKEDVSTEQPTIKEKVAPVDQDSTKHTVENELKEEDSKKISPVSTKVVSSLPENMPDELVKNDLSIPQICLNMTNKGLELIVPKCNICMDLFESDISIPKVKPLSKRARMQRIREFAIGQNLRYILMEKERAKISYKCNSLKAENKRPTVNIIPPTEMAKIGRRTLRSHKVSPDQFNKYGNTRKRIDALHYEKKPEHIYPFVDTKVAVSVDQKSPVEVIKESLMKDIKKKKCKCKDWVMHLQHQELEAGESEELIGEKKRTNKLISKMKSE
ncbi:unnamed protein product [Moneuplotes crassus]|uniref:Uncharacterized protein n=1 Tax=Euplotes crassus TaxID=5936 RepID=A0AAD1UHG1_EUPCR|nr:unnamed protein product [Moneuplotes crassus]